MTANNPGEAHSAQFLADDLEPTASQILDLLEERAIEPVMAVAILAYCHDQITQASGIEVVGVERLGHSGGTTRIVQAG